MTAHPHTTVWLSFSNDNMKGVYKALIDYMCARMIRIFSGRHGRDERGS